MGVYPGGIVLYYTVRILALIAACGGSLILASSAFAQPDGRVAQGASTSTLDPFNSDEHRNKTLPKAISISPQENDAQPNELSVAETANEILEKAKSGDLEGYVDAVSTNPKLMNIRWAPRSKADLEGGKTAMHFAASRGDIPMLKFLIEHGADVSFGDHTGNSPLHFAINKENRLVACRSWSERP